MVIIFLTFSNVNIFFAKIKNEKYFIISKICGKIEKKKKGGVAYDKRNDCR